MLKTVKSLLTPTISNKFPQLASSFSHSPFLQRQRDVSSSNDEFNRDPDDPPMLFVVQPRIRPEIRLKSKLEEALNLANYLEQQRDGFYETEFLDKEMPPHLVVQNPVARTPHVDTFFGVGTVNTIKCHVNNLESKDGVDAIFVNAILSGIQQRNLERHWDKPVLDRVGLIIEIFNAHAQTKEAKLQAELVALMYKRSRLVRVRGPGGRYTFAGSGEAEVVSARGRGNGGRGFISGAGETELQLQRRRIIDRRKKLLSEIKEVRRTRAMQRASRKRQGSSPGQDIATIAVVGYTNAGKSTLVSALSNSDFYCDDHQLFATVDPKIRGIVLPSGREVLLSDTVGFILLLQLVEAFHATLEEVVEADLLVHILDSSAPNLDEHREAVMQVLQRIGVSDEKLQNMIEVWNKVDLQENEFDAVEVNDENYASSLSGEEDADALDQLSGLHEVDDEHVRAGDGEDSAVDEQVDESDCGGWMSCEEEEEEKMWFDYYGSSIGSETVGGEVNKSSIEFQSECSVKTSAVTGVGLKELLDLIDDKFGVVGPSHVVKMRDIFERKWRPEREKDMVV